MNPLADYDKLKKGLAGEGPKRESKIDKQNRLNKERELARIAENERRSEAVRIADKLGKKAGLPKSVRDAGTKLYRPKPR